jgi:hypothetical protein
LVKSMSLVIIIIKITFFNHLIIMYRINISKLSIIIATLASNMFLKFSNSLRFNSLSEAIISLIKSVINWLYLRDTIGGNWPLNFSNSVLINLKSSSLNLTLGPLSPNNCIVFYYFNYCLEMLMVLMVYLIFNIY